MAAGLVWLLVLILINSLQGFRHASYEVITPKKLKPRYGQEPQGVNYWLQIEGVGYVVRLKQKKGFVLKHFPVFTYGKEGNLQVDYPFIRDDCYYHGFMQDKPFSLAALSTCSGGLRGLLQVENKTYGIEPVEGSASFQHMVYKTEEKEGAAKMWCGLTEEGPANQEAMIRNIEEGEGKSGPGPPWWTHTRYAKVAVVVEHERYVEFGKNETHVALQVLDVIHSADSVFRLIGVQVSLVGLVIWSENNFIPIGDSLDVVLEDFNTWRKDLLAPHLKHDAAHLFMYKSFATTVGIAFVEGICDPENAAGAESYTTTHLHEFALIFAHELGHNLGMLHDTDDCTCNQSVCVMSPYQTKSSKFSNCSFISYYTLVTEGNTDCLLIPPDVEERYAFKYCGNKVVESGEQCDCGSKAACERDPCCQSNCMLRSGALCAFGKCCANCQYRRAGSVCRERVDHCDLPEYCSGTSEWCPEDFYVQDGAPCSSNSFCYHGRCSTHADQCKMIFGHGVKRASEDCFRQVNAQGDRFGNCGITYGSYQECKAEDSLCGRLQCENVKQLPSLMDHSTIIQTSVGQRKCWGTDYHPGTGRTDIGAVKDGTFCGQNMMCIDKKCTNVSLLKYDCNTTKCHHQGQCNNLKHCHCFYGWAPPDCLAEGGGGSIDSGPPPDYRFRAGNPTDSCCGQNPPPPPHQVESPPPSWFQSDSCCRELDNQSEWDTLKDSFVLPEKMTRSLMCLLVFILKNILQEIAGQTQPQGFSYAAHEVIIPRKLAPRYGQQEPQAINYWLQIEGKGHMVCLKQKTDIIPKQFPVFTYSKEGDLQVDYPFIKDDCYYHGFIQDKPHSLAVLSSCSGGLRGMIRLGNKTYEIQPIQSSATFQHVIYHLEEKENGITLRCGLTEGERSSPKALISRSKNTGGKTKPGEDWWTHTRYVKNAVVVEHELYVQFDRNETLVAMQIMEIIHIANSFYKPLGIHVSLVGLEIWSEKNFIEIADSIKEALVTFNHWRRSTQVRRLKNDAGHFFVYKKFGSTLGLAHIAKVCDNNYASAIESYMTPSLARFALTFAHELGHILGMVHDGEYCTCGRHACIMAAIQAATDKFSNCSYDSYFGLRNSHCLFIPPDPDQIYKHNYCGNKIVEHGEECDCGSKHECRSDRCCQAKCTLRPGVACSFGKCCANCQYLPAGTICRENRSICDLPEYCNGTSEWCPQDLYVRNGAPCRDGAFCYNGSCSSHREQCREIFGWKATVASEVCFRNVNIQGDRFGNCGLRHGIYKKCSAKDILCGRIQCDNVDRFSLQEHRTIIQTHIGQRQCWGTDYHSGIEQADIGAVRDGTSCGTDLMCINGECTSVSLFKYDCNATTCHNRGRCNNLKHCHCDYGWAPPDCLKTGYGGSIDSGPPRPCKSHGGVTVGIIVFLLTGAGFCGWVVYYRNRIRHWMRIMTTRIYPEGNLEGRSGQRETQHVNHWLQFQEKGHVVHFKKKKGFVPKDFHAFTYSKERDP
ncbi:hypothetical protein lerEdw1_017239 [Lerista edwardsae]|nr:hypothetical protein lerEdw1_017239 [Lerista edwardsae]